MPDFDVDFCMDRRDEVIDYVAHKYGRDNVSQIITYGTMAAKAVLRDTGRVLGMGYTASRQDREADSVASRRSAVARGCARPQRTIAPEPDRIVAELKALYESDDDVRDLVDLALKLEDLTATPASMRAASSSHRAR